MTHEECVTFHMSREVRSYRDLPKLLYHFQTKERDEPRPRAGLLRTREFIMKDSYSFDRDFDGLDQSYALHTQAYDRIFERVGLEWYKVESDVGMMGGTGAHEYMAPCAAGENDVALAEGYAANVEIATAEAQAVSGLESLAAPVLVDTPGAMTIEAVSSALGVPAGALIKAMPVIVEGRGPVLVLLRGDHQLNETKLRNAFKADVRAAQEGEVRDLFGTHPGFIGPVGAKVPVAADLALRDGGAGGYVAGANEVDKHLRGVEPGRDFEPEWVDVRSVVAGDKAPNGGTIRIEPAIEVGNIFKLGTRYSVPLGANYLDEAGKEQPIVMGSYGIGPARIMAAAVEQFADDAGISWPRSIAPYDVELVGLGKEGEEARDVAERLYEELRTTGLDVLYDDRAASPGEKFADAELLGCPLRVTVGRKALEAGELEAQVRRGQEKRSLPLEGAAAAAQELWRELP
jgi:prolyl-tRNA synthetase